LVAPVFFFLLLGIAAYGIYFSAISSLQELTADAARASVAGVSATERQTIVSTYVSQSSPNYRLLSKRPITVSAAPYPGDPTRYTVTLQTDISSLPLQGSTGIFPMPSAIIKRTAVVRIGGY
jgi:Flp pilus assembly protein TadG